MAKFEDLELKGKLTAGDYSLVQAITELYIENGLKGRRFSGRTHRKNALGVALEEKALKWLAYASLDLLSEVEQVNDELEEELTK